MRYTIGSMFLAVVILSAMPAFAYYRGGNVNVEIVSDNGGGFTTLPFKNYSSGQTRIIKKYLEARRGENYSVVVRNDMPERIGVVIAVDGRNIITGKKSFLKNNEMMYIVKPYGSARLEGWRTDQNTVHKFYFTDVKDSYSVRTFGDSSAMGVITVAVFREKERPRILYEQTLKEKAPAPSAGAPAMDGDKRYKSESAGTGFGNEKYAPVTTVEFEPEGIPFEKILVKYEWHEVLCKKGILKCWPEERNRLWDESGYAPYPPEYGNR
ncbi:MAG: hypothetical protein WC855_00375 [Thermodesulfovibrionales bacterium]